MSQTTPISAIAPNVATLFRVSVQSDRVRVNNDSNFYLLVYFGSEPPSRTDPTSRGWHETVGPGDHPLIHVPGAPGQDWWVNHDYGIAGAFEGSVWILPFTPVGAMQPTGVLTGASLVYVTSYAPNEPAESGRQTEAFIQGAKQARLQVTDGAAFSIIGSTDQTSLDKTIIGGHFTISAAVSPALFAANVVADSAINIYYYGYSASAIATAVGNFGASYFLDAVLAPPSHAFEVASFELYRCSVSGYATAGGVQQEDHVSDSPTHPIVSKISVPKNALIDGYQVLLRYRLSSQFGTFQISHNIRCLIDGVNQSALEDRSSPIFDNIGVGQAPYNPVYNPQTF